jgi:hypothetical protein
MEALSVRQQAPEQTIEQENNDEKDVLKNMNIELDDNKTDKNKNEISSVDDEGTEKIDEEAIDEILAETSSETSQDDTEENTEAVVAK